MKPSISAMLKSMRNAAGISVSQTIQELKNYDIEISANALYSYERGVNIPNADVFLSLCQIYHCVNPLQYMGVPTITDREFISDYLNSDTKTQERIKHELASEREALEKRNSFAPNLFDLFNMLAARPIDQLPVTRNIDTDDLNLVEDEKRAPKGVLPQNKKHVRFLNQIQIAVRELPLYKCDWILQGNRIAIRSSISSDDLKNQYMYEAAGFLHVLSLNNMMGLEETDQEIYKAANAWAYENSCDIKRLIKEWLRHKNIDQLANDLQLPSTFIDNALSHYHDRYKGQYVDSDYIVTFKPDFTVERRKKK